ncbi:MAG: iron-sulfur cluster assembly accessory protein [Candidatus Melainabacteria bacterium]|nr:iron-sulfur cluster assembly accessory protein [Candidatus Melainabacteria bacterium]
MSEQTQTHSAPSALSAYHIVQITPVAAEQMRKSLVDLPTGYGIRIGVIGGGCAGLQYDLQPCNESIEGDFIFQAHGLQFYIHPVAAAYLKGTTIDYSHDLNDGGFKYLNPNAANACGCGTSFGI